MNKRSKKTYMKVFNAVKVLSLTCSFEQMKVTQICKEANISTTAFYHHFSNKESIYSGVVQFIADEFLSREFDKFYLFSNKFIDDLIEIYDLFGEILLAAIDNNIIQYITRHIQTIINIDFFEDREFDFSSQIDNKTMSRYFIEFYTSSYALVLFQWVKNGKEETKEQMKLILDHCRKIYVSINDICIEGNREYPFNKRNKIMI